PAGDDGRRRVRRGGGVDRGRDLARGDGGLGAGAAGQVHRHRRTAVHGQGELVRQVQIHPGGEGDGAGDFSGRRGPATVGARRRDAEQGRGYVGPHRWHADLQPAGAAGGRRGEDQVAAVVRRDLRGERLVDQRGQLAEPRRGGRRAVTEQHIHGGRAVDA